MKLRRRALVPADAAGNGTAAAVPPERDLAAAFLRRGSLIAYLRQAYINASVLGIMGVANVIWMWPHVSHAKLLVWGTLDTAIAVFAVYTGRRFSRHTPSRASQLTLNFVAFWAGCAGAIWGSLVFFTMDQPVEIRLAPLLMVIAMACGAATTLAAIPWAATAFIVLTLGPACLAMLLGPLQDGWVLSAMLLFVLVMMQFASRRVHAGFLDSLQAEHRNEEMLREITAARAEWLRISDRSEAFALLDRGGRLVLWNNRFCSMLQITDHDMVVRGAQYVTLLQQSAFARDEQTGGGWLERQLQLFDQPERSRDQRFGNVWVRSTMRRTSDGGFLVTHIDITALKHRESELMLAQDAAQKAIREVAIARDDAIKANILKTTFLANMSHELRTPLNAIIGFSEIISSEMMGPIGVPQYKTYIEDIMQAGRHLLGVINDILDMSKIEAQQMKIRRELIDIPSMLRDVQRLLGPQAKAAGIEVTLLFPEGLVPVPGDPIRLRQILLNLLSNAIKFTPDGGTVQAGAENSGSDSIDLFVRDNGVGMTAEEVEIAMQPFRQVASVFAREHQGTGLGLPLSAALAELHGGKLLVQSQPGVGTKVIVTLPLQPDETTLQ